MKGFIVLPDPAIFPIVTLQSPLKITSFLAGVKIDILLLSYLLKTKALDPEARIIFPPSPGFNSILNILVERGTFLIDKIFPDFISDEAPILISSPSTAPSKAGL